MGQDWYMPAGWTQTWVPMDGQLPVYLFMLQALQLVMYRTPPPNNCVIGPEYTCKCEQRYTEEP